MADVIRIKRRVSGSPGAPSTLANAEVAYNEVDHILYYGEGTGGSGGSASVIVGIGGQGLASNAAPTMDGTAASGSASTWARADHVHPSDTTRAPLASPGLTGTPTAPTAAAATSTTQIATTAFVMGQASNASPAMDSSASAGIGTSWARNDHVHPSDTTRAPLASPGLTGTPTAPTAGVSTNTTQIATTAFVIGQAATAAPVMDGTAAVGSSTTFARQDHVHPSDTSRASLASPALTGTPTAPTAAVGTNTTQIATTQFVISQAATLTSPMDGTAAVGSSTTFARQDHVHPTDTSRAPTVSPNLTGVPISTTAAVGTNTTQIATCAFVLATPQNQFAPPTAPVNMGNQTIINVANPVNPQDGATKNYVDATVQGLQIKPTARLATAAALSPANLYNNGTAGVGATLTAAANGVLTIDGVAVALNDVILVKNEAAAANNGLYTVTTLGSASVPYVLTRHIDMNTATEMGGAFVPVGAGGTANANTLWLANPTTPITVGTTAIPFTQLNAATTVTAGPGISIAANQISAVGTTNRIAVGASIDIASNYVGQASLTTLGTVTAGVWNATAVAVSFGGTGATTLAAGYARGNGTAAMTTVPSIPNTDVTGLGTMSTQAASAVAITGGTIDNITFDGGTF